MSRAGKKLVEIASVGLALMLLLWSVAPIYNMFLIALDPEEGEVEFSGNIWPPEPSLEAFETVITQDDRYLADFWLQFGNSVVIGAATVVLTLIIASLAAFAAGRLWRRHGGLITNTALLTYAIPAAFLIIPFYRIVYGYGLENSLIAVVAAYVTFATPFALLVLRHYATAIPRELDDAARIDGASNWQLYLRIYLPLVKPALAVIAVYALLVAWNDYLYQVVLLTSQHKMTVAMMQGHLFDDPDAAWNAMMAAALIYAVPPVLVFFALRRFMTTGLTLGGARA
jgi:multiple sugar transport system permease protein